MARKQSEAFVLRSFDVGEQDKIVALFSRDIGLFKGIAKGARKFGNRFGSSLEPLTLVKVYYYEKESKDLVTISNCDLIESFFDIQKDLETSFTLSYFVELIEEFYPARSKDDTLFRLLHSVLQALKTGADLNFVGAYFEAWLLKLNGIQPDFWKCRRCHQPIKTLSWLSPNKDGVYCQQCVPKGKDEIIPEIITFLDWIRKNPPPKDHIYPLTPEQVLKVRNTMRRILVFHMEKEPKSLQHLSKES
jgi:DNA repair protein RecO (recombination protein O)